MRAHYWRPGVPAAGHIAGGYWHPGRIDGCRKCPQPRRTDAAMSVPTVICHGVVDADRDEERGKVRYRCPGCGLDVVLRFDVAEQLFAPVRAATMAEVPLPLLSSALQRGAWRR